MSLLRKEIIYILLLIYTNYHLRSNIT